MKFRKDINALRALAVLAVVIYHFEPNWLPGGFIGVDVFFVISGFLMTSIIMEGFKKDTFSLAGFYAARLRRIVPALAVMCMAILVFGWFYMMPTEYEVLGKHVRDSITFASNLTYNKEAGYFDAESKSKWLLHTWSLSVEWQFYLLYPVVLLVLVKAKLKRIAKEILIALTAISFSYGVYLGLNDAVAAYYILPSRAWELCIGSLAYFYPISRGNKYFTTLGCSMIVASLVLVSESILWPGYAALIPTLGTLMVLCSAKEISGPITSNPIIQYTGLWSYSIYLWHWPVVVFLNSTLYSGIQWVLMGIALSIFLGMISFYSVEKVRFTVPISDFKTLFTRSKPLLAILLVFLPAQYVRKSDGLPDRVSLTTQMHEVERYMKSVYAIPCKFEKCDDVYTNRIVSDLENGNFLFIGDSHATALMGFVNLLANKMDWYGLTSRGTSAPSLLDITCMMSVNRSRAVLE